ncbi:MAG: hypothetical protein ABI433_17680, partial [Burkholderiaceae bacterium]
MTNTRLSTSRLLLSLCLVLGSTALQAAEDTPSGSNSFNTPSYPSGIAPRAGAPTEPGRQGDAANQRAIQNQNAVDPTGRQGTQGEKSPDSTPRRADLPPAKPSEFQKFVEAATGRLLPLFGSSFFTDNTDSFSPVDNVPVSADYTVGPGDEIMLRAWGSIDVDYRTKVDRNGLL